MSAGVLKVAASEKHSQDEKFLGDVLDPLEAIRLNSCLCDGSDPSRKFHCHLRVKVDGGEGTLPITARTADQRSEEAPGGPLVSMSCTDKLAK